MILWHAITEYVNCFAVSGGDFVSVVDYEWHYDFTFALRSKATSEALGIKLDEVIVGYYEIYPSCNMDVTSTDVGDITTYTIVVSECPAETEGSLYCSDGKTGMPVTSTGYLTIEENKQSTLGNVTTVSVNRPNLANDNIDLKLTFYLITPAQDNLRPWSEWDYYIH